jgi:8-oxo-dGTP diphosphatase
MGSETCIKATVGAVVEREGLILLEKRNNEPFYGKWCIPGGHIDFGEGVEAAVCREVEEETGYRVTRAEFFSYYTEYYPEINWHAVALIFRTEVEGSPRRQEAEVQEMAWFTPEDLHKLEFAFQHEQILNDYLDHRRGKRPRRP